MSYSQTNFFATLFQNESDTEMIFKAHRQTAGPDLRRAENQTDLRFRNVLSAAHCTD